MATAIGDVKVKIGGKQVSLSDLAAPHIPISFDGVRLISQRSNSTLDISTVFDENNVDSRSMTQQQFIDESDINKMMDKYVNNRLALMDVTEPIFGDFTSPEDFLTTQRKVANFKSLFDLLPAKTRERFDNEPYKAMAFAMDEANEAEAVNLGILPKEQVVEPEVPTGSAPAAKAPEAPAAAASPVAPAK